MPFVAIELLLTSTEDPERLENLRTTVPTILITLVLHFVSILAASISSHLAYKAPLRNRFSKGVREPTGEFGAEIISLPAIATTPADLGFVPFFLFDIYVALPLYLLSPIYMQRFNLRLDPFLAGMAGGS